MFKHRATHHKQKHPRRTFWVGVLGLLGLALVSCTPQTPTQGTLEVQVNAPPGVSFSPNVSVVGPDGSTSITTLGKTTLGNLTPGEYTLSAAEVTAENGYRYRAGSSTVRVEAGETVLANVNYQASTGKLSVNVTVNPAVGGFVPAVEVRNSANALVEGIQTLGVRTLNLPPGAYTVVAGPPPPNYRVNQPTQTVVVSAGQERVVNVAFGLGFGTIAVTVNVPSSAPGFVPNVNVTGPGGTTAINTAGQTTLTNQVVGSYTVSASNVGPINGVTYQPTIAVSPANANPFTLGNEATQNVTIGYVPTGASVAVTLQGLAEGDNLTLTLRAGSASGPVVGTRTITSSSSAPQTIRFDGLPFGSIHASASGVRRGTYLDAYLISDQPSATTSQDNPSAAMTLNLRVRPYTGHLFVGGNGALDNTGLTVSGNAIPQTRKGDDRALLMSDSSLPAPPTGDVTASLEGLTLTAGLYRLEFDPAGNLYVVYQFVSGESSNRVLQISRANLEAGVLAEASNRLITGVALGERTVDSATLNNVTDLAFDAEGNLWIANQASGAIACISASRILAGTGPINQPNRVLIWEELQSPRALAFDRQGNLWIAGGRNAFQLGLWAYLVRIPRSGSNLDCPNTPFSGTLPSAPIDVRLNLNLPNEPGGPFYQPSALALSPDGTALWVADLGGGSDYDNSNSSCYLGGSIDINTLRETVIKVPLSGANLTPSSSYTTPQIAKRITIGSYNRDPVPSGQTPPDRGLQQATGLAFDSRGNLWIAANNNLEVDPGNPCYATAGFVTGTEAQRVQVCSNPATAPIDCPGPLSRLLTDRRGKVYVVSAADLIDATGLTVVTPRLTLSGPSPGSPVGSVRPAYGFTGIALHIPPIAP